MLWRPSQASAISYADSRQSRPQYRRSGRSGTTRPSDQPQQTVAQGADCLRLPPSRASASMSSTRHRGDRRHPGDRVAPHLASIAAFADAGGRLDEGTVGPVGSTVSHGVAAGSRRRPRDHSAELECRHAFLLHQCARHDRVGTGPRDRRRVRAISASVLGDRAASSCRRVPQGRKGLVRAHRHSADQRQLVLRRLADPWPAASC